MRGNDKVLSTNLSSSRLIARSVVRSGVVYLFFSLDLRYPGGFPTTTATTTTTTTTTTTAIKLAFVFDLASPFPPTFRSE